MVCGGMRPRCTLRGRVVYDRKPHLWRISDLYRVMDHVFVRLGDEPSQLADLLYNLSIRMLEIILGRVGLSALARVVYLYSFRLIDFFVQQLRFFYSTKEMAEWAKGIESRIHPYLPVSGQAH